jgi:hypothetical protein
MAALATVFIAVIVSLLIARVATVALRLTGLSRDAARFQARSALSGTGFTTTEAESVVNHPVRRQIVMTLMLVGSAGLVTVIATIALSFTGTEGNEAELRLAVLAGGLVLVWLAARSSWVDRHLSRAIGVGLRRWTDLEARDYSALLHLAERYAVGEIYINEDDWVADRTLGEVQLREEGVVILGVSLADGTWLGAPTFETRLAAGDSIVAYGPGYRLAELDERRAGPDGDRAHEDAVEQHVESVRRVTEEHRPA